MSLAHRRLVVHRGFVFVTLFSIFFPSFAQAWSDKTHAAIAYVAYRRLDREVRDRVDEILVLHPLYKQWTKGAKLGQAGLLAFVHAATWPNCIQTSNCPGYKEDGVQGGLVPTSGQEQWQNIGFADLFMHKYWHLIQLPMADGVSAPDAPRPNLETQLQILTEALNSNADDKLKAYDLAWVANLVGELHQPLNCVSRFSVEHPNGDLNGREVKLRDAPDANNLHDYWDNLLGAEEDVLSAMKEGKALADLQDQAGWWDAAQIDKWINESVELARKFVYTPAIVTEDGNGNGVALDPAYRKAATLLAVKQAALAGNRLGLLLNKNLR